MAGKKDNDRRNEPSQEFENFQRLLKETLSVPKKELDKRRAKYEQKKADGQTAKRPDANT